MTAPGSLDTRPSLAVWKFASCDGCQLSLLDCEEELLALTTAIRIDHFTEMSRASSAGPYDISLVEGSVTTPDDADRIKVIRANSRHLVTIGACAATGGIQALRNFVEPGSYKGVVYAHPEYLASLDTSTPISAHVPVDYELHGCPIDRTQLLEVLLAFLQGRRPVIANFSVCQECKSRATVCLLVEGATACLGPVTRAGCGALCPSIGRGCFGCFGPSEGANVASLLTRLRMLGVGDDELARLLQTFNVAAPAFRDAVAPLTSVPVTVARSDVGTGRGGAGHDPRFADQPHDQRRRHRARRRRGVAARAGERRPGHRGRARDLRTPALLRGDAGRAPLHARPPTSPRGSAGSVRSRIRCRPARRWRTSAGSTSVTRSERYADCSTAGSGSRVTRCTSTCCTLPTSSAALTPSNSPQRDPAIVTRGLDIKRTGNLIMATVGGRAIHPVNVRVGGFYQAPDASAIAALAEPLRRARDAALATVDVGLGLRIPRRDGRPTASWRCVHPASYAIDGVDPDSSEGLDLSPAQFAELAVEEHVARSTALHARLGGRDHYLTGPLARYALNSGVADPRRASGARRPDSARRASIRSGASSCARWNW